MLADTSAGVSPAGPIVTATTTDAASSSGEARPPTRRAKPRPRPVRGRRRRRPAPSVGDPLGRGVGRRSAGARHHQPSASSWSTSDATAPTLRTPASVAGKSTTR